MIRTRFGVFSVLPFSDGSVFAAGCRFCAGVAGGVVADAETDGDFVETGVDGRVVGAAGAGGGRSLSD